MLPITLNIKSRHHSSGPRESMQHTISVLVNNKFGVLSRISGLFSGRGFNIESLNVAETNEPNISRMTIVTRGDDKKIEQITKQLNKREMLLIKMNAEPKNREEILRIVDIFRAKVVDVSSATYTIEITGDEGKLRGFLELLRPLGIKEMVRSGRIALGRGTRSIN